MAMFWILLCVPGCALTSVLYRWRRSQRKVLATLICVFSIVALYSYLHTDTYPVEKSQPKNYGNPLVLKVPNPDALATSDTPFSVRTQRHLTQDWESAIIAQQLALALKDQQTSKLYVINDIFILEFDTSNGNRNLVSTLDVECTGKSIQDTILKSPGMVLHFLTQHNYDSTLCMLDVLEAVKSKTDVKYVAIIAETNASSIAATLQQDISRLYRDMYGIKLTIAIIPSLEQMLANFTREYKYSAEAYIAALAQLVTFLVEIFHGAFEKHVYDFSSTLTQNLNNVDLGDKLKVTSSISSQMHASHGRRFQEFPMALCKSFNASNCMNLLDTAKLMPSMNLIPSGEQDYIFTSYFTSRNDPQRGIQTANNDFQYILHWYSSLKARRMKAVLFHDGLSPEFMRTLQQDHPDLQFQHWDLGGRTTNDARFLGYLDYLTKHPEIERIQCTDISDVVFQHNPFDLMTLLGRYLYIGQDLPEAEHFKDNGWMMGVVNHCGVRSFPDFNTVIEYQYLYNAGMIGGDRALMLDFLQRVKEGLAQTPTSSNCNMAVVNYVVHKYFDDITFTGFPFNNFFKHRGYDYIGVYSAHK